MSVAKPRPFGGNTAREVAAEAIARRNGRDHIAPMDWSEAGLVLKALGDSGFNVKRMGWR